MISHAANIAEATGAGVDVMSDDNINFEYTFLPVSDLRVKTVQDAKTGKTKVESVLVQDEPIAPTQRFWTSLFSRYGFNSAFFKYFSHEEVFNRISETEASDRMRVCIERGDKGSRLLAVTNPTKPLVSFTELHDIVSRYGGDGVTYHDGIIESTHIPRVGGGGIDIGGDVFEHRFLMSCPIDGYGLPNTYLALLRQICSNGVIGYTKAFRSSLALGKATEDVTPSLIRVLEGFGNDEGYAAVRQRLESAQKSWASVYEATNLQKAIIKMHASREIDDLGGSPLPKGMSLAQWYERGRQNFAATNGDDAVLQAPIFRAFEEMTGSPTRLYGIANVDALSAKRQRTLPVRCTMYDMINFATELASHYAQPSASRKLQAWVGDTLSTEYDMENTMDKFTEFKDFHLESKVAANLTGSEHEATLVEA